MNFPSQRRSVVLAFWGTILLGVPVWYLTTQVSRAALPNVPALEQLRPRINLDFRGLSSQQSSKVVDSLNVVQNELQFAEDYSSANKYTINWSQGDVFNSDLVESTRQWNLQTTPSQLENLEESMAVYLLSALDDERRQIRASQDMTSQETDLRIVKYSPAYDVVVSLLNGDGISAITSWPVEQSLETTLLPMIELFKPLARFTVDSQIQYYADLTFEPQFDESTGDYVLSRADLNNFINSAEWTLASAQGESKPLNLIIYIPKASQRPLVIRDGPTTSPTNSFLIPQFGSVVIYNPPTLRSTMSAEALNEILSIHSTHLSTLLGVPTIPKNHFEGHGTQWRIDGLFRARTIGLLINTHRTLLSIPKIVNQITNMHVPKAVASGMSTSIHHLLKAQECLTTGATLDALEHAQKSHMAAESAFFDDQMLALLYFPDEHKYGVYMPLFGPLFLPLLMALIREIKVILGNR